MTRFWAEKPLRGVNARGTLRSCHVLSLPKLPRTRLWIALALSKGDFSPWFLDLSFTDRPNPAGLPERQKNGGFCNFRNWQKVLPEKGSFESISGLFIFDLYVLCQLINFRITFYKDLSGPKSVKTKQMTCLTDDESYQKVSLLYRHADDFAT